MIFQEATNFALKGAMFTVKLEPCFVTYDFILSLPYLVFGENPLEMVSFLQQPLPLPLPNGNETSLRKCRAGC